MSEYQKPDHSNTGPTNEPKNMIWVLVAVLAVTLLIIVVSWITYVSYVGGSISSDSEKWSHFGGFFAGVGSTLAPILSAASILFVWWQGKQGDEQNAQKIDVMIGSVKEQSNHTKELISQTASMQSTVEQLVSQTELMRTHQKELQHQGFTFREQLTQIESQSMSLSSQAESHLEQLLEFRKQVKMSESFYLGKRFDEGFANVKQTIEDRVLFYYQMVAPKEYLQTNSFDKVFYKEGAGRPILEVLAIAELLKTSDANEIQYFKKRYQLELARCLQHSGFKHLFEQYFEENPDQKLNYQELLGDLL